MWSESSPERGGRNFRKKLMKKPPKREINLRVIHFEETYRLRNYVSWFFQGLSPHKNSITSSYAWYGS